MTQIYFVRHAEPDYRIHDDALRGLTPRGQADCALVTDFLADKGVTAVLSSPYLRALDTVRPFAAAARLPIQHVADFRERRVDSVWIEDFDTFCRQQWADFTYHLPGGECLQEVQTRNIAALQEVLAQHAGETVVIGGHGTAIATVLNHYDPSFGHAQFERMRRLMPWIVRLDFEGDVFLGWEGFVLK